jgi:hypothetical protein
MYVVWRKFGWTALGIALVIFPEASYSKEIIYVLARLLKMPSFVEYVNLRFSQNSASTMTLAPVATLGG